MGAATEITVYGCPLAPVSYFKDLGIVLLVVDYYWAVVVCNLEWARKKWAWLTWVLGREVLDAQTLMMFYVVLV